MLMAMLFGGGLLLIGGSQPVNADQNDPRLSGLFETLVSGSSPQQAQQIETSIWRIWTVHPNNNANAKMQNGVQLMQGGDLPKAEQIFTALLDDHPNFAEAWNKRATVRFFRGNDAGSRQDILQVIQLEPRHFGALSGLGMIEIRRGNFLNALNAYQAAFRVNPNLPNIGTIISQLSTKLKGKSL